jgi:hypothetical protein
MRIITKKYKAFNIADIKKDDELCNTIYQKFWLENENNINPLADENLESFKTFADCLGFGFDYSLSNAGYPDRSCYIRLDASNYDYTAPSKRAEQIAKSIEGYKGNGYCICEDLRIYADKLLEEWHKDYSIHDFATDIQHKMFELWFADNRDYFSKESFLECVEFNDYEFDENNQLI